MKICLPLCALLLLFFSDHVQSQSQDPDSLLIGTWKGTSICQIKDSPCHDEIVVYHISRGKEPDSYLIQANKIVNGEEEDMGTLPCIFDKQKMVLTSNYYEGTWTFQVEEDKLEGTVIYKGRLYRKVIVSKMQG